MHFTGKGGGQACRKRLTRELTCICAKPMDTDHNAVKAWGRGGNRVEGVNGGKREDGHL